MNSVDPFAPRDNRRRSGGPGALVGAVLSGVVLVGAGGATGYAISAIMDRFRAVVINSVFSDTESTMVVWMTPVAVITSIIAFTLYAKWNHRYSGSASSYVGVDPLPLWLLGTTVALWWTTSLLWTPADMVGTAVDPLAGRDKAWGAGAWVLNTMRWWLPALSTLFLLVTAVAGRPRSQRR